VWAESTTSTAANGPGGGGRGDRPGRVCRSCVSEIHRHVCQTKRVANDWGPEKKRTVHPLGSNSPSITPKTPSCWMRVGGSVRRGCQQYPPPPASTGATAAMYLRSRPRISSENTENLRPRPRHGSPVTRRHRATQGSGQRYTHLRQGKRGRRTGAVRGPWVIVHLSDLNAWIQPHPRDGPHTIDKHAPVTFLRGGAIAWLRPNSKMVLTERRMMPAPGGGNGGTRGK